LIRFGNFDQKVEETFLTFYVNIPFDSHVIGANLQFMGHSSENVGPPGKVQIRVVYSSFIDPKLKIQKQNSNFKNDAFVDQIDELEHGDVWVSSDLKQILDVGLLRGKGHITLAVAGQVDLAGLFGFAASHTELKTCVSPTLYLTLAKP
jgi:hypothetical protein